MCLRESSEDVLLRPKLMGLDVSRKRIGIAFNDPLWTGAEPREVLQRASRRADFDRLCQLIRREEVETVVCGLPVWEGKAEQPQARYIQEWARRFLQYQRSQAAGAARRIVFWDEQYTTAAAGAAVAAAQADKELVDAWAAALLLEDYMRSQSDAGSLLWGFLDP